MGGVQGSFPERVMTETDVNPARGRREGCLSGECYSRVWSVDMAYQRVGES